MDFLMDGISVAVIFILVIISGICATFNFGLRDAEEGIIRKTNVFYVGIFFIVMAMHLSVASLTQFFLGRSSAIFVALVIPLWLFLGLVLRLRK